MTPNGTPDFWSAQVALRELLRASALCNLLCAGCSGQAAARCAGCSAICSWSCRTALCVQLYSKIANFQPGLRPCTTRALKSCDFCLEKLLRTSRDSKSSAQTTRQLPKTTSQATNSHGATARALRHARSLQKVARAFSESKKPCFCTSTTPIPAEASSWNVQKTLSF